MKPVKIAHVTTIAGSLQDLLLNQLRSMADEGYAVTGISAPGPEAASLEARGIRHIPVEMKRTVSPAADFLSLVRLYGIMRRERFTIVHTHTPKAGLLGQLAARLAGAPIVVNTVHGFYFHDRMRRLARQFYIAMETVAARCSDLILSQNAEDVRTALREGICEKDKMHHLGNGIDLAVFNPERFTRGDELALRRKLGIAHDAPVVGFVGRLAARRKGFLDFLAAASEVSRRRPDARFVIAGAADAGKPDAVEPSAAREYGIADKCVFLGNMANAELPLVFKIMNVIALPSLFEGVPRAIMEASAMGTPAVVSDVKGNREAVLQDRTGLLVPYGDARALADAMLRLLDEPETARRMGAEGRRMAAELFDERRIFQRIKDEYARLLREKRQ